MKLIDQHKCHGGYWQQFEHESKACGCPMRFSVFLPYELNSTKLERLFSTVFWLSGLTCSDQNFVQKAACEKYAVEQQLIIIAPDTSPRGCNIEGEDDDWDFGSGAGFYLDATREPWNKHYNMYSYIVEELYAIVIEQFPVDAKKVGIAGHSMGGHGALSFALKHPEKFRSVSAFAPICSPSRVPWGKKAFEGYLKNFDESKHYDACELIRSGYRVNHILVDQGKADNFLEEQLKPELLIQACHDAEIPIDLNMRDGYDHSYFFISSFIEDHLKFHKSQLDVEF